jgi:hypothetical protein
MKPGDAPHNVNNYQTNAGPGTTELGLESPSTGLLFIG